MGFGGAFLLMPRFYALQNKDQMLPELVIRFHPVVFLSFVILPTAGFSLLAVGYAWYKLRKPVLLLLKNDFHSSGREKRYKEGNSTECSFMSDLKRNSLPSAFLP